MNINDIKLDEDSLKFEKLRLETFKNIQKYAELTIKTLRETKIKIFLMNLCIIGFVVAFIGVLTLVFYALLGNNTNISQKVFTMIIVSLMVIIPMEIWFHNKIYTVNDDPNEDTDDSISDMTTILEKSNGNSIFVRFISFTLSILKKLKRNLQRHDLVANITTGIYTMVITSLFEIDKYPDGPYSTLESYIELNAPKEFVKLYYESKDELKQIAKNVHEQNYDSLSEEEINKINRLGKIVETDFILLKYIQLFCHEGCISVDECDKIIQVKGEKYKDAYNFMFTEPLDPNKEYVGFPPLN